MSGEVWLLLLAGLPLLGLQLWAIADAVRRRDLALAHQIGWLLALAVIPIIALGIYIVVRPPRAVQVSGGHADMARAEAIVLLAERRQRGEIPADEYGVEVAAIASYD
ncbi:MAG: hypothetical protein QNM02_20120 [Acidimicrobiia bacterium]|nr:hypothetical protein [Acidimicrobiia bacterium]